MAMNAAHLKNLVKSQDKRVKTAKTVREVLSFLPTAEFENLPMSIITQMDQSDQHYYMERLKGINAEKSGQERGPRMLSFKVSEKGAVSVYGNGRFPTTLYKEQWDRLLEEQNVVNLRQFLKDNESKLSKKGE